MTTDDKIYRFGAVLVGGLVFIGSWLYCIAAYGFLFGVGLGWLPSGIVAVLAGLLWQVIAVVLLLITAAIMLGVGQ